MSTTKNVFGTELKEKLLAGIEKLNASVSSTLGPGGRTVLIREQNGEVKENLSPSSTGTVARTDDAAVSLSDRFSERLIGSVGFYYTRTKTPAGLTAATTTDNYGSVVGMSYKLGEQWGLDTGYR